MKLPTIPDGYMQDARGALIPIGLIKPIDMARNDLVIALSEAAVALSQTIREFRDDIFGEIGAFVELSLEQYGLKHGGAKGNITLFSFDGRYKIQVANAEHITFDERLQAAKELIDQCIHRWSDGARNEIRVLVQDAFQTDKTGRINTGRVLGLRRLEIVDEQWQEAMRAIGESVQVVGSKRYVRFYRRVEGTEDQYLPIPIDIAAA